MKKAHLFLIMSTLLAGCGKDINGTYMGTETISNMSSPGANQPSNVTISVSGDDETKTISWISTTGSTMSGKLKQSGDNTLMGTLTGTEPNYMGGFQPGMGTSGAQTNYQMTFTFTDNTLSATGFGQPAAQQGQTYPNMGMGGGSRSATAKKTGDN